MFIPDSLAFIPDSPVCSPSSHHPSLNLTEKMITVDDIESTDSRFGTLEDIELPPRLNSGASNSCFQLISRGWLGAACFHIVDPPSFHMFGRWKAPEGEPTEPKEWEADEIVELQFRRILWETGDGKKVATTVFFLAIMMLGFCLILPLLFSVEGFADSSIWNHETFRFFIPVPIVGFFVFLTISHILHSYGKQVTGWLFPSLREKSLANRKEEARKVLRWLDRFQFTLALFLAVVIALAMFMSFKGLSTTARSQLAENDRSTAEIRICGTSSARGSLYR